MGLLLSSRPTIGTVVVIIIALFIGLGILSSFLAWMATSMDRAVDVVTSMATNTPAYASDLIVFLSGLFNWLVYIFTNPLAIAVILLISLVILAFEAEWR